MRRQPLRAAVAEQQLHDLGKLLFAFSIFWAYIWVCQYLLIWYGNIPEEVRPLRRAHERGLAAAVRARTCWSTVWSRSSACCRARAKRIRAGSPRSPRWCCSGAGSTSTW